MHGFQLQLCDYLSYLGLFPRHIVFGENGLVPGVNDSLKPLDCRKYIQIPQMLSVGSRCLPAREIVKRNASDSVSLGLALQLSRLALCRRYFLGACHLPDKSSWHISVPKSAS